MALLMPPPRLWHSTGLGLKRRRWRNAPFNLLLFCRLGTLLPTREMSLGKGKNDVFTYRAVMAMLLGNVL